MLSLCGRRIQKSLAEKAIAMPAQTIDGLFGEHFEDSHVARRCVQESWSQRGQAACFMTYLADARRADGRLSRGQAVAFSRNEGTEDDHGAWQHRV